VPGLVLLLLVYAALAPAVVNGDGLGYLRAAAAGGIYPGHLGYLPLLRLLPGARPVDLLLPARLLSMAAGLGAVLCFAGAARRLGLRAWLPAAAGLGFSYAVMVSSSDVESYAPALACVCAVIYCVVRRWEAAAALAATAAALLHVENLLLAAPLLFLLRRRGWALLPAAILGALYVALGLTPLHAGHGFHYPLHLWTPLVAVYGAAKALVYSPYRYEASWAQVIGGFAVGAAALAALLRLAWAGGLPLGRNGTLVWAAGYGAVGVAFFPSDHERWIFLLPLLWLSVAAAARVRSTAALAAGLLVANLALWGPRARDGEWRRRAEAATAHLQPGDLLISPGHGWDEYVGFWSGPEVRRFPLAFWAGELGSREALEARLFRELASAPRVVLVRMGDDGDPMGWKELRLFGVTPATLGLNGVPLGDGVDYLPPGGATRSRN
jgi:hypothetical protein